MASELKIKGYDYVEFYVGSARMVAYWFAKGLGFDITGYAGPETGVKDRMSFYLTQNNIKMVVTSAINPGTFEVGAFAAKHGDGVKRWSLLVEDVAGAFEYATEHGAIPIRRPYKMEDENGYVDEAAIRIYDDTELMFVNYDHYRGIFKPGFGRPLQQIEIRREETGLQAIDHIVGNVRENEMDVWVDYFNNSLGFETYLEFGPGDISTKYSALLSKVVRSKDRVIKNPINEPFEGLKKSQIEEYVDAYHGTGIQHIAIACKDIISSIRALRANGVEFLTVPDTYYNLLRDRKIQISENIDDLQELGILCDMEGKGYLLQLFTKPIGDRPTFFFEVIQRCKGSEGFGQGNFQALFESIERDQALRGTLDR
jgi:4-hydroxyphenylpyruvate dioxygenase